MRKMFSKATVRVIAALIAISDLSVAPAVAFSHPDATSRRNVIDALGTSFGALVVGSSVAPANASIKDPKTGILLPSEGEIEAAIPTSWDDDDNPFVSMGKDKFGRLDSAPDSEFYADPRFVEHVDENAVKSMTSYIDQFLEQDDSVLDLCSSWTSHISPGTKDRLNLKVSGLGMNQKELEANTILADWAVLDLNKATAKLPYDDASFDKVLCQLSIDYLTRPLDVMKEVSRVLKPNGKVAILFSNRLFIQKAVGLWTGADDIDHAYTVGAYLHFSGGGFEDIKARDLSQRKGKLILGDPLYFVTAVKR
mmetsp:Transcript_4171/g.11808  ORF Transcript_4171/g.11808 Transcript_4171/m.11808 type:complete len:309 (+) Transcript_4171:73-999(+)